MNEASDPSLPVEKPAIWVRAFLIGLPLCLAFMVPLSLVIYYQRKHQPEPAASQFAAMLRKDLNAEDFARYQRIMQQDIGERSLAKPENLDAATAFIESTMGYDNMGYAVQRQTFEVKGRPVVNLVAELPGKSKPGEVVLVLAAYDATDVSGIAALMCAAHAITGSEHARTIRFAAVANAQDPDPASNGLWQFAESETNSRVTVNKILPLSPFAESALSSWKGAAVQHLKLLLPSPSAPDMLDGLRKVVAEIEAASDAP